MFGNFNNEKAKILIIDDSTINIEIVREAVADSYIFFSEKNGFEGIKTAQKELPDIILLDIMMPGISGYEVLEQLKSDHTTSEIPVIFITSINESEFEEKGLSMGAIDYITKPINPAIVKLRIKNHIELKRNRDLLKQLSTIDGLTGILNRRCFDQTFSREWTRMLRNEKYISFLMIDIDYFKNYNDTYGHQEGDFCLKSVAEVLKKSIHRSSDYTARYGGEEFVVLLPDTDLDYASGFAEKLLDNIRNLEIPHSSSAVSDFVSISIGVSSIKPSFGSDKDSLLKSADQALYKAKKNGRNRFEVNYF